MSVNERAAIFALMNRARPFSPFHVAIIHGLRVDVKLSIMK